MSGLISPEVLAAQTILASVLSVLYFTPLAISYSSSAIIGTRLGGNDVFGAQRAATIIVSTSCLISSGWIVAVLLLRNQIAALLAGGKDGGVTTLVVKLMPLAALFHAFDAFQAAMTGVVKGTGQQRSFALIILLCYWVVGLPTAALLTFRFDYGVNGLWYGMIVAAALQSISYLLMLMFRVSFTAAAQEAASRIDVQSAYLPLQGALEKDLLDDDDIASY
jgi:MATE family multidrug resistance protein